MAKLTGWLAGIDLHEVKEHDAFFLSEGNASCPHF
jgi:hypothetical protein